MRHATRTFQNQMAEYYRSPTDKFGKLLTKNVTFQITDACDLRCTYCYQINKGHRMMSKDTAKKAVDMLFEMYDKDTKYLGKETQAVILDFIGGEPLLNIELIDYICTYFMDKCIEMNHPWLTHWRASMISNGVDYFNPKVQEFFNKFKGLVSFAISIDGPKELHDACRLHPDGKGSFDEAMAAFHDYSSRFEPIRHTKATIAPENLEKVDEMINFFYAEGLTEISANPVFEHPWTVEEAKIYYSKLLTLANFLLKHDDAYISLFQEDIFEPMPKADNRNWCGGTGAMIAFDPDGVAYPCIRYMESSLPSDRAPLIIGNVDRGIYKTLPEKFLFHKLNSITRRSQSTDECFNCPIAKGCAWCSAENYVEFGTVNKRSTNICNMHKARSLANCYFWNTYYRRNNIEKRMKVHLPKEDALRFISEEEYNNLVRLSED